MIKVLNLIPGDDNSTGCGWGVCGRNLKKFLPNHCEVVNPEDEYSINYERAIDACDAILAPVTNWRWGYHPGHELIIERARANGKKVVGYGFHEFDILGTQQIDLLVNNWDALACGSTWMYNWVRSSLITESFPASVVLQGVDRELFQYRKPDRPEWMQGRFVIASCGKFEYRKSQDVVIESFRRFKKSVPEAMLMMCWGNPWPETMRSMADSKYEHNLELQGHEGGAISILGVDRKLIDPKDQVSWMMTGNDQMPFFYQNADIALFPNRCEAGTNLPLTEALACGIPSVIVDEHGHRDIVGLVEESPCTYLEGGKRFNYKDIGTWVEPCLSEINSELYRLYRENHQEQSRVHLSNLMNGLTWDKTASDLVKLCESVVR